MTAELELQINAKQFAGQLVLDRVSIRLRRGEIVALVGASGCGKSTLLRIAAGLDLQYSGTVQLAGQGIRSVSEQIGFVFQEPRLFPWLTLEQNVAFDGPGKTGPDKRALDLIDSVGLKGFETALPKALSGGMAQRAAIARALYRNPRILLLDEPFSAVDPFTRIKLQDLLVEVGLRYQTTMLLVTHDVDEAVHLADRVLVLSRHPGTVVAEIAVDAERPRSRRDGDLLDVSSRVLDALEAVHAF